MSMPAEVLHGDGFQADVQRTSRVKTVSIRVIDGKVSLIVPQRLSVPRIEKIVSRKSKWIQGKLLLQKQPLVVRAKEYVSGEAFTYLGRNYRLKVKSGKSKTVKLINGRLTVEIPENVDSLSLIEALVTEWYLAHATKKFQEKTERYSKIVGATPASVGMKTLKSRWGSCSRKGVIHYNWKVIIASSRIVDYVVVHELCHLKYHNHSSQFWKSVERVLPDYRESKEWLKVNGRRLII